jgi:hypothetical protein
MSKNDDLFVYPVLSDVEMGNVLVEDTKVVANGRE